jgi:hypothetical protein
MSTPPRMSERKRAPINRTPANVVLVPGDASIPTIGKAPELSERLPGMTDYQLRAHQSSAGRISREPTHPKRDAATRAVPQIEEEIRRRAALLEGLT